MVTNFKEKVFKIVSKIKRGRVLTYGQVARRAGNPKAARAVGQIMAHNKNQKIPCHRVIGAGEELVGYSRKGRIRRKLKLLRVEGVKMKFKI